MTARSRRRGCSPCRRMHTWALEILLRGKRAGPVLRSPDHRRYVYRPVPSLAVAGPECQFYHLGGNPDQAGRDRPSRMIPPGVSALCPASTRAVSSGSVGGSAPTPRYAAKVPWRPRPSPEAHSSPWLAMPAAAVSCAASGSAERAALWLERISSFDAILARPLPLAAALHRRARRAVRI